MIFIYALFIIILTTHKCIFENFIKIYEKNVEILDFFEEERSGNIRIN